MTFFAAASVETRLAAAVQPAEAFVQVSVRHTVSSDLNLAMSGLGVLVAAAGGVPAGGSSSIAADANVSQSTSPKQYEAEVALTGAKQALDNAVQKAKAELLTLQALASRVQFAQGGELDALAPEQRKKTFDNYLSRAQAALGTVPPDAEAFRSHLSHALTVFNPTTEIQKRYYGPAVPGPESSKIMTQLKSLIKQTGYKGDAATNPVSLFALRGNVIEAQSTLDTIKDAAAQAKRVQLKAAEADKAQAQAVALRDSYQAVRTETLSTVASFESSLRTQLTSLMGQYANQPEVVNAMGEALIQLAGAADAFRLAQYGQSKQFLDKLKQTLTGLPGVDLTEINRIAQRVVQTQQAANLSWTATHKATRLSQEHERMNAGFLKAIA